MSASLAHHAPLRKRKSRVQKSFRPNADNLGSRVVNSALFTIGGVIFRTAITVGSMAVLARLLSPADFGLIAMATVITELAAVFSNFGFGSILIQRPRVSRIQIDTMNWCALALGALLTVVVYGLSFSAGEIFNDEHVGALLRVLAVSFILEELTLVPRALLMRRMQFRLDFYVQALMLIGRAGTAVALALAGFGVWSLAWGPVVGLVIQAVLYQYLAGYWPRLRFSRSFLASSWLTNGGHFGNGILFYINANLDTFLIGRALGATALGNYSNAKSLTDEIRVRMVQPLQRVLFPAFAAIQTEQERFQRGILRSARLLSFMFIPIGFGMAAEAEILIRILYGDQWLEMIPLLQLTALATGFGATTSVSNAIFNAKNEVGLSFRLFLLSTALSALFIVVGSHWGLLGVVWARLALVPVGLVFFWVSLRLVELGWADIFRLFAAPLLSAAMMYALMALTSPAVGARVGSLALHLLLDVLLGGATYLLLMRLIAREHIQEVMSVFQSIGRRRKSS